MIEWHKWIRVTIKKKEKLDQYLVWAFDYGVPMLVESKNIVKLPRKFAGMKLKCPRIKMGGMKNCVPVNLKYDILTASSYSEPLSNWTDNAINKIKMVIDRAIKLQFEASEDLMIMKRPHFFGRLMVQREDGAVVDVLKCLLDLQEAKLTDTFKDDLTSIDTLKQESWTSNGTALNTKLMVFPVLTVKADNGFTDQEFFGDEEEDAFDDNEIDVEDEEFFDESASRINPGMLESHEYVQNTSNALTSDNVASETQSKVDSERTVTPNGKHQQKYDRQKDVHFKHNPIANRNGDGKHNSYHMNNQRSYRNHPPQNQRGSMRNYPQQQFRPPLNASNQQRYQLNQPQKPFNAPRRWDNTYNPSNFAARRQDNPNRSAVPRDNFGSDDFNANFGKKLTSATSDYSGPFLMNQSNFMQPQNVISNLYHGGNNVSQSYPSYTLPPQCDLSHLPAQHQSQPHGPPNRKYQNQTFQRNKFNRQKRNDSACDMKQQNGNVNDKEMPNVQEIEAKLCNLMNSKPKSND